MLLELLFHSIYKNQTSKQYCDLFNMPDSNSQDTWDEICNFPHQAQIDVGRQEGRQAGLQAGFNDGFALGRTKGMEFGMELGFIRGFLNTVEAKLQSNGQGDVAKTERLQKKLDELHRATDDFPSSETMFESTTKEGDSYSEEDDSEVVAGTHGTDVMGSMQRIRAKFKVLTAQLKVSQYSLKQVMDDTSTTKSKEVWSDEKVDDKSQDVSSEW
jgi:hypothetical protein